MLVLKDYQSRAIEVLREYFTLCSALQDPDTAFYSTTKKVLGMGIPYHGPSGLPGVPSVCIRIPTGGGKTLLACHAAGTAAQHLLRTDHPLILWLVPSNAIKEQTLLALGTEGHPYREAVRSWSFFPVEVMEVSDALHVQPSVLDQSTVIIVATMQAFRVEDVDGRKVYEPSSDLAPYFTGPISQSDYLERFEDGSPKYSLVNVLKTRRPIVIVDEAHNARTDLSLETLARFRPSCILEFTATPDTRRNPSNVIYSVSAAELKAEAMIKVPILLQTQADWKITLARAIDMQSELERAAIEEQKTTGEYIRPVVLIQAQPNRKDRSMVTVAVVKDHLERDLGIPPDHIAIATADKNDLEGVNILDPASQVRFIITVQALREGWDCSFAYVLCSVAEMSSPTAVEQILGRVMRLPSAKFKHNPVLNSAYAFVASQGFAAAADALADALIQNGFERFEAKDLIARMTEVSHHSLFSDGFASEAPTPGTSSSSSGSSAPSSIQKPFVVPYLSVKRALSAEPLTTQHFMTESWHLAQCDHRLSRDQFSVGGARAQQGEIDISDKGKIQIRPISETQKEMLLLGEPEFSEAQLVLWLDRQIEHPDVTAEESSIFLAKAILYLTGERGYELRELVRDRFRLRDALAMLIEQHRSRERAKAFQNLLLSSETSLVVDPSVCFSFDPAQYPYNYRYTGRYAFKKHYYPEVGDLREEGEEFECAVFIDSLDPVEFWVRNLDRHPKHSFWLQTASDRFYPDFVCKLTDGRILVVEYKGEDRWSNEDSREKRLIGQIWESKSSGRCLFVMPKGKDFEAIRNRIAAHT
jgi:type III restriction enzyme